MFSLQLLVHFPDSIGQNLGIIALFIVFKEKLFCQKRYIQSVPLGSVQYIVVMNEIETNCTMVLIFLKMQLYQGLNNCREEAWRKMQKYQVQLRIGSLLI